MKKNKITPLRCEPRIGKESPDFFSQTQANNPAAGNIKPRGPFVRVAKADINQNQLQPPPVTQARKAKKPAAVTMKEKPPSVLAKPNSLNAALVSMDISAPKNAALTPKHLAPK